MKSLGDIDLPLDNDREADLPREADLSRDENVLTNGSWPLIQIIYLANSGEEDLPLEVDLLPGDLPLLCGYPL